MPPLHLIFLALYTVSSLITFTLFFLDKRAAIHARRRIPERTLHLFSFLFGVPGAILAIAAFHHKNRKPSFWLVTAGIAGVHLAFWVLWMLRTR